MLRYCHDEFSRQYYPTEGVDVLLKRTLVESRSIRLIIWDISGSSLSSSLLDKYLYNANVSIVYIPTYTLRSRSITVRSEHFRTIIGIEQYFCYAFALGCAPFVRHHKYR